MEDNTDDVLDNWEDEDADVLERRMEERQKQEKQKQQKKEKKKLSQSKVAAATTNQGEGNSPVPPEIQTHLPQTLLPLRTQDTARTEYVAPIKILKRQADSKEASSTTSQASTMSSSVQRKSLAEREADYASARARILGSGYDDAQSLSVTNASGKSSPSSRGPTSSKSPSPSSSRGPAAATKSSSPSAARGPGVDAAAEAVKRQPRGPNGTKGFKARVKS